MASGTAYPNNSGNINTGIGSISPLPGLINKHYNPLDMGKYEGNPNHNPTYTNFQNSEFNTNQPGLEFNTNQPGLAVMSDIYYGDGQKNTFGDSHSANQFRKYLESMGTPIHAGPQDGVDYGNMRQNLPEGSLKKPVRPMPMPDMGGEKISGIGSITNPTNYDDKFSGYDTKIGGFDNQFKDIVGRLDKLEQGIGTMANTNVPAPPPVQGGLPSVYTGNNSRGF